VPRHRIPSLNWLRVFEAAAQTESFSAAANILNMSPSAVSQQISALEHRLGENLFVRSARRVQLSDSGAAFLPTVREALSSIETSAARLFGSDAGEHLTIEANTIFATSWLAPRLAGFTDRHPGIGLDVNCVDRFHADGHERADIIVSFGPSPWPRRETVTLFSETLYPVATPDVAASIETPADLLGHRLIDVAGHRLTWRLVLGRLGVGTDEEVDDHATERSLLVVSNTTLAFSLAAAGGGIALARRPATDWQADQFGLVRCLAGAEIGGEGSYVLASHPTGTRSKAAEMFRDWLISEAEIPSQNR